MVHFQNLGFSDIYSILVSTDKFEFLTKDSEFTDGGPMVFEGKWKKPTPSAVRGRGSWERLDREVVLYKKSDIYVATVGLKDDFESLDTVLKMLGRPSFFQYGRHSNMLFRYDCLFRGEQVEETYVHVEKVGDNPWITKIADRDKIHYLAKNYVKK